MLLKEIKSRIHTAQIKAAISVNRELIKLYWHIGKSIVERQRKEGWGKSVVERLSQDIQKAFPGIAAFPRRIYGTCARFTVPGRRQFQISNSLLEI